MDLCIGDLEHYLSDQRSLQRAVDEKVRLFMSWCVCVSECVYSDHQDVDGATSGSSCICS